MNFAPLKERLDLYERLMRLDKPIGILLLLWPTLWALWIASAGQPDWLLAWIFVLGTVLMRSAGCVVNDYRRPRFRSARRAHQGPSAGGRQGERARSAVAGAGADRLRGRC